MSSHVNIQCFPEEIYHGVADGIYRYLQLFLFSGPKLNVPSGNDCYIAIEELPLIVDFLHLNMVDLSIVMLVYQRANPIKSH